MTRRSDIERVTEKGQGMKEGGREEGRNGEPVRPNDERHADR